MKARFLLGLLAAAAVPSVMGAADQSIGVNATVAKFCKLNAPGSFATTPNTSPAGSSLGSSTINIVNPISALGIMQSWGFTFEVNATCNGVAEIKLTTLRGGLKDPAHTSTAPGFINRFDYIAQASFDGGGPAILETNGTAGAVSDPPPSYTNVPNTGNVLVQVNRIMNTSAPLMAGSYSDTLTISLIPQP